jgi:anti-sigma regulatory factor (Ser/Thr protein kinase)
VESGSGLLKPRNIELKDSSQAGEARRTASVMARELDFTDVQRAELEIVVTELARNVVIHGKGGHLTLVPWRVGSARSIDVVAADKGNGMKDVALSLADGYSTAGTSGIGMGSISRLSRRFEVYTQADVGTVVFAKIGDEAEGNKSAFEVGTISVPVAGEDACGDSYAVHLSRGRSLFMVVDGLGHGPIAQEAADLAVQSFHTCLTCTPTEMVEVIHDALKATRGAALAIAEIQFETNTLSYAGVGNIAGVVLNGETARSMVSHNGTVGHLLPRNVQFSYPWQSDSLLLMHSDGLLSRWNLETYPGLQFKHPALIAGVMIRDLSRGRDDATVLVARQRQGY